LAELVDQSKVRRATPHHKSTSKPIKRNETSKVPCVAQSAQRTARLTAPIVKSIARSTAQIETLTEHKIAWNEA
jgi:hypothetical protein